MATQRLTFQSADGVERAARLVMPPAGHPHAMAILAHCFACADGAAAAERIARCLADRGVGVLRVDFDDPDGDDGAADEPAVSAADLVAVARLAGERWQEPTLLVGHSHGAVAMLEAAGELPDVRAIATIAAPWDREKLESLAPELGRPLLILHSPEDDRIEIDNATNLFTAAAHPKSFVALDGADHLLSDESDAAWAGSVIATWASRWLPPAAGEEEQATGDRVVTRTREAYRTEIQARGHTLVADEPLKAGGGDEGPTPYDLLVAGLGACTGMTLRMYADRKEWPLEEVVVHLRHSKIYSQDVDPEQTSAKIDQIEREIEVLGPLDDDQRARLLEIANRCPVHRTLESDIRIVSKVEEA